MAALPSTLSLAGSHGTPLGAPSEWGSAVALKFWWQRGACLFSAVALSNVRQQPAHSKVVVHTLEDIARRCSTSDGGFARCGARANAAPHARAQARYFRPGRACRQPLAGGSRAGCVRRRAHRVRPRAPPRMQNSLVHPVAGGKRSRSTRGGRAAPPAASPRAPVAMIPPLDVDGHPGDSQPVSAPPPVVSKPPAVPLLSLTVPLGGG